MAKYSKRPDAGPPWGRGHYSEDGRSWSDDACRRWFPLTDVRDTLEIELEDAGGTSMVAQPVGHARLPVRQRLLPLRRSSTQFRPAVAHLLHRREDLPGPAGIPGQPFAAEPVGRGHDQGAQRATRGAAQPGLAPGRLGPAPVVLGVRPARARLGRVDDGTDKEPPRLPDRLGVGPGRGCRRGNGA
jgi:hypothetical protein